ncbi:MAG TPA: DUF5018 domain-containing protein [Candidatus Egerieousia sp.]|nr:DUF5018 domain-containing protein [Candidatus Egerieousia sp.]
MEVIIMKQMKNFMMIMLAVSGIFASCQSLEKFFPTTESLGLTSVSAMFNYGTYKGNSAATFTATVSDLTQDIVIQVPYYYPEESNNQVTDITNMKVYATMDYNCFIEPKLGILDLSKANYFTYTDGRGKQHKICIRGEIVKLSGNNIQAFSVTNPSLTGIVDNTAGTVTFPVGAGVDVSAVTPSITLDPHAVSDYDGVTVMDLYKDTLVTVTAQNGNEKKYKIILKQPEKTSYGFRSGSENLLWSKQASAIGSPYDVLNNVSLAICDGYVVVNSSNGTTPVYLDLANGSAKGHINIGSADASGCVKNDDAGNMIICNYSTGEFKIWRTNSVKTAPTLLLSYTIPDGFPLGYKVHVHGDLDGNALIVATVEGIDGVSVSNDIVYWVITGGTVGAPVRATTSNIGATPGWGAGPGNNADITPLTSNIANGLLASCYDSGYDNLYFVNGTSFAGSIMLEPESDGAGWGYNNNAIGTVTFNKAVYAALLCTSHFPQWGMTQRLYMYDASNPSSFTGTVDTTTPLVYTPAITSYYSTGDGAGACGDVILYSTLDGYMMYMVYIEHNNDAIECYKFDCIKQ